MNTGGVGVTFSYGQEEQKMAEELTYEQATHEDIRWKSIWAKGTAATDALRQSTLDVLDLWALHSGYLGARRGL